MRTGWLVIGLLAAGASLAASAPDDCTRGAPKPVFADGDAAFRSHHFEARSAHEAIEDGILRTGERLTIRHWGCESFVLTFRYARKGFPTSGDARLWHEKASQALDHLSRLRSLAPVSLALAAEQLRARLNSRTAPTLGEEMLVEGDGTEFLQTRLSVKGGGAAEDGTGYVEFELAKGPL